MLAKHSRLHRPNEKRRDLLTASHVNYLTCLYSAGHAERVRRNTAQIGNLTILPVGAENRLSIDAMSSPSRFSGDTMYVYMQSLVIVIFTPCP